MQHEMGRGGIEMNNQKISANLGRPSEPRQSWPRNRSKEFYQGGAMVSPDFVSQDAAKNPA
jgi:hypothetical protein